MYPKRIGLANFFSFFMRLTWSPWRAVVSWRDRVVSLGALPVGRLLGNVREIEARSVRHE